MMMHPNDFEKLLSIAKLFLAIGITIYLTKIIFATFKMIEAYSY